MARTPEADVYSMVDEAVARKARRILIAAGGLILWAVFGAIHGKKPLTMPAGGVVAAQV